MFKLRNVHICKIVSRVFVLRSLRWRAGKKRIKESLGYKNMIDRRREIEVLR